MGSQNPTGPFNRALDNAVARHVSEQVEKYCPDCKGTKAVYVPNGEGGHTRKPCQRCEGTGLRGRT